MSVDYGAIGQRIKRRRKAAHRTQDNLAEALSVSVGYISQIERGVTKISLDTLSRIANFLGCDLAELVSGVSTGQQSYLNAEIERLAREMDDRQRRLLLAMAELIIRY